jgi:hypothetical protein
MVLLRIKSNKMVDANRPAAVRRDEANRFTRVNCNRSLLVAICGQCTARKGHRFCFLLYLGDVVQKPAEALCSVNDPVLPHKFPWAARLRALGHMWQIIVHVGVPERGS